MKLAMALNIISVSLATARLQNAAPMAVVVLDAGGNLVAAQREDGAGIARFDLAYGKAWGSLGLGVGSRTLSSRASKHAGFFSAAATLVQGRLLPSPGGVIVSGSDEAILGAVGVSGDVGDVDEFCIIQALEALSLTYST